LRKQRSAAVALPVGFHKRGRAPRGDHQPHVPPRDLLRAAHVGQHVGFITFKVHGGEIRIGGVGNGAVVAQAEVAAVHGHAPERVAQSVRLK
jgi:hypothetical protein